MRISLQSNALASDVPTRYFFLTPETQAESAHIELLEKQFSKLGILYEVQDIDQNGIKSLRLNVLCENTPEWP